MNGDPLAQLRDIHLPQAVSWWPPAVGWWLLLALALLLVFMGRWLWRRHQQAASKRAALAELAALQRLDPVQQLPALSQLLRRCAVSWYPRQEVAGLTGERWLEFLDRSGHTQQFSQGVGQVLAAGPYQPAPGSLPITQLHTLCSQWIACVFHNRRHHV